jgi:hypothetical protein
VRYQPGKDIWEYQAPAVLNQAAPVQNTWYYVLGTVTVPVANCRVIAIGINIEDTNETLECDALVDGETIPSSTACTQSTPYFGYLYPEPITRIDNLVFANDTRILWKSHLFDGRRVQVRVRKTTAAGVGNLIATVMYALRR